MQKSQFKKGPPLYYIETYGCQMNKYDSEVISGILESDGYLPAAEACNADLLLVNTCAVRKHAEDRALGRINALAVWKKAAPARKLGIIGCVAQELGEALLKDRPYVDFVIGPDQYRHLPDLLNDFGNNPLVRVEQSLENYDRIRPTRTRGISGWIAIMRGCNNFCSYCIVPYTRGRERSRNVSDILREVRSMNTDGFKEITLLGQNVNSYHDGTCDFPDLLHRAALSAPHIRFRFMTSHPKDLSGKLIDTIAETKNICPHIHLPLQAGANRILNLMNRKYTREHYLSLIHKTRNRIPDVAITTDVMVGFPTETEAEFEDTLNIMETVRFDDAFLYYFSPRKGTAAADMEGQLPDDIKLKRLDTLISMQRDINRQIKSNLIGASVEAIPEAESKKCPEEWIGKTPQNQMVVFPKADKSIGEKVRIKIESMRGATLRGVCVESTAPPETERVMMEET